MKNPWGRKNPLLSMWLSGANAVAGRATAQARRQAASAAAAGARQMTQAWTSALTGKPAAQKRRKKTGR